MCVNYSTRIIMGLLAFCPHKAMCSDSDSVTRPQLHGSFYNEAIIGHIYQGNHRTTADFPHTMLSATLSLPHDWQITFEGEYRREYRDGWWQNDFDANYSTNKLYVSKGWNKYVNIKVGIIDVPVGADNSQGPLFTIYDPEGETALIPMTWHEGGVAFYGEAGRWNYTVGLLGYGSKMVSHSKMLGATARAEYKLSNPCTVAYSMYAGATHYGELKRGGFDYLRHKHVMYNALDMAYSTDRLGATGSAIWCTSDNACALGAEAGYDLVHGTDEDHDIDLIPFVRLDYAHLQQGNYMQKGTLGVNFTPWSTLTLKSELGWYKYAQQNSYVTLNISLGYTLEF